jgi:hypothetical protein
MSLWLQLWHDIAGLSIDNQEHGLFILAGETAKDNDIDMEVTCFFLWNPFWPWKFYAF